VPRPPADPADAGYRVEQGHQLRDATAFPLVSKTAKGRAGR
jgi:hypothetical protein